MAKNSATVLNLSQEVNEIAKRLPSQEYTLCKGLKQPFNNTNSGSRKIMQGIQMEQATQLIEPETPIISTGYENQFGELNSNFIVSEYHLRVLAKITKFEKFPNNHYWLVVYNEDLDELTCIEKISYKHITEFYGYLFDNSFLDSLVPGSIINPGDVIKKTISYDEYNNRAEGINLTTMYIACEDVKEDPIVISESASKRFMAPLIDKVEIKINENDILLNIYGEGEQYKTFPDVNEEIKNCLLCAVRRELKDEEALFSQSWERLKTIMMNDKRFIVEGKVIDIDVFCNNPEKLNTVMYNSQIKTYYDQSIECARNFVNAVDAFEKQYNETHTEPLKKTYDLKKQYKKCIDIVNGKQFISERVFNNIILHIYTEQRRPLERGDKITDRYGGKGVISRVRPDDMMPQYLKNGEWHPVDVLYSKCTCFNRLNDGQVFETSITYAGWQLVQYLNENYPNDYDFWYQEIRAYIELFNPKQAEFEFGEYRPKYENIGTIYEDPHMAENRKARNSLLDSIMNSGTIYLCLEPISSNITIDKLAQIYQRFPYLDKYCPICVPQKDSNGKYRMIRAYRNVSIGFKYIFRLKQFAIEKFSVVSLASTNIRNENSKSRMSKTHNARFASTPVRIFGEMEASSIGAHIGTDILYEEFMLTSSSPAGRRAHEELLLGDPFKFDITLNKECTSLNADIGMAYLKTLGAAFRFGKIKKFIKHPILFEVMRLVPTMPKTVMRLVPQEYWNDLEAGLKWVQEQEDEEIKRLEKPLKNVIEIIPGIYERTQEEIEYKLKRQALGI